VNSIRTTVIMLLGVTVLACATPADTPADSVVVEPPRRIAIDTTRREPVIAQPETVAVSEPLGEYVIDKGGVGKFRLGQTLDDARRAFPNARFTRRSDGEGVALVGVAIGPDTGVVLFADEPDPDAPIDWSLRISDIQTFSPAYHTVEGVHAGSLAADAERAYGKVKMVFVSEIESRQYVEFENQPPWLTLRLDYSGDFPEGSQTSTTYKPGAKIMSISVD
jgi:hypothetical protein